MGGSTHHSSPSSMANSRLKIKLRGVQAALKEYTKFQAATSPARKRTSHQAALDDIDDTDSEIDIIPPSRKVAQPTIYKPFAEMQSAKTLTAKTLTAVSTPVTIPRTTSRKIKKVKAIHHEDSDYASDDAAFDACDEGSSPTVSPDSHHILSSNILKRSERILDPKNAEHAKLIAAAPKAGPEYYDSDADELPGNVKDTSKPHLFRNVKWGSLATDYTNPGAFSTEPELYVSHPSPHLHLHPITPRPRLNPS